MNRQPLHSTAKLKKNLDGLTCVDSPVSNRGVEQPSPPLWLWCVHLSSLQIINFRRSVGLKRPRRPPCGGCWSRIPSCAISERTQPACYVLVLLSWRFPLGSHSLRFLMNVFSPFPCYFLAYFLKSGAGSHTMVCPLHRVISL